MIPYRAAPDDPRHHAFVTEMFDQIAPRYDRLNRIMTLGIDLWWRRRLVRSLDPGAHPRVIDICTGTGDVAIALRRRGHKLVVGLDAAGDMLVRAKEKGEGLGACWCEGNRLVVPFLDGAFDAATASFGMRNIADRVAALQELSRVVRHGGLLLVLEALESRTGLRSRVMKWYQRSVVPIIGAIFAGQRSAYEYLARSIAGFGTAPQFEAELRQAGWQPEGSRWLLGGSVVLFRARNR